MEALIVIFWILAYIVLPVLLVTTVVATGFVKKNRLKKIYRSVFIISFIHLLITAAVSWVIRDGLLGPKSTGEEAFHYFFDVMKIFLISITSCISIATVIFIGRIKLQKQTKEKNSNQSIEPIVTTPVD